MFRSKPRLILIVGFLLACVRIPLGVAGQISDPGPLTSERVESALTESDVAAIATLSRVVQRYQPLASTSNLNGVVTYLVFKDLMWTKGRLPGDSLVVRVPITINMLPDVEIRRETDTPDPDRVLVYMSMYMCDPGFPDGILMLRADGKTPGRGVMKLRGQTGPRSESEVLAIVRRAEPVETTRESDLVVVAAPVDSTTWWCGDGDSRLFCRTMRVERVLKGTGVPERLKVAASSSARLPTGRSVVFLKRVQNSDDYVRLTTQFGGVRAVSYGIVDNGEKLDDFAETVMHAD